MSNTNIEDLSREDLLRVLARDRFVKEQMANRIAALVHENIELVAIVNETQAALGQLRGQANGEVTTPSASADVTS
jgi:hypothetical protein